MDRERAFPDLDAAWVLHDGEDLLAIDKPAGVPSQAADPQVPDDVVSRLRRDLTGRGKDPYLGVHQRLDAETSGVLVFVRRKEHNAHVARQFEGRHVDKRYLACVRGWPARTAETTLRHHLEEQGGRQVPGRKGGRGKLAVTHVRVLERAGDRAMLELRLETGRTHQARAQLAAAGAPIAGDALYGGAAAPRLMLHARSLAMPGPKGRRLRFEAPVPPAFGEWLARGDAGERVFDDLPALERSLRLACNRRFGLLRCMPPARATTAFRLVNEGGDALPGLAVDVYDDHLVAQLYADDAGRAWHEARRGRVLDALAGLGFDGVYLKVRPKQANTLVDTRREDLAPREPVRGTPAPDPLVVSEEGIEYLVRLGDGLSTGLFLDQRANRRRVRAAAAGKRVLNLFSYTCGFSIAAAVGGAARTTSVDASPAALERGREGFAHLGFDPGAHDFVAEDAFAWLRRAAKKGARYDLIVLDPPSYSSTRARRFVASSDYAELAAQALALLSAGGAMLACTNHRGIPAAKFRRVLFDAARLADVDVAQVKDLPPPADYPPPLGGEAHLKAVWVTRRP